MKTIMLTSLLISFQAVAAESFAQVDLRNNHQDIIVMQCDDTFYQGIELRFPSLMKYPKSRITFKDCSADWKVTKVQNIDKNDLSYTQVRLKGAGDCQIEVAPQINSTQRILIEIAESC